MEFEQGYRLKVSTLGELTKFLGGFRVVALRAMAASYAEEVAATAVSQLDAIAVGLAQPSKDILRNAMEAVRAGHDRYEDGIYAPDLNMAVSFYFVGSAVMAVRDHAREDYVKAWESRREVVRWGWSEAATKPQQISQTAWDERGRYWGEVGKMRKARLGQFQFSLLSGEMPQIGWASVQRALPSREWRVRQCVGRLAQAENLDGRTLSERDRQRLADRAEKTIVRDIDKDSFSTRLTMNRPYAARQPEAKAEASASSRKREPARVMPVSRSRGDENAVMIDHADIVVANDGRAFMAVPYVEFRQEDRVFIQVGSRDITFLQNGVQFGAVSNISAAARDFLRGLTSITLVEVNEAGGKRLLRAKHTAMVSDISLSEGIRRPIQTFRRRSRDAELQEI